MSRIVLIVKFLFFGYNIDYRKSDFKFTFLMFMAARQFHWHEIRRRRRKARAGKNSFPPNPLPFCPPERSVWRAKRAVNSVQKRFGFRQTNAPELNFQEFCRLIQPREARQRTETLARRARRGSPSVGSKSLAILSICFAQLKTNNINL